MSRFWTDKIASLEQELEQLTESENYEEAETISEALAKVTDSLQKVEEQLKVKLNQLVKVAKERNKLDQVTIMDAKVKKCRKFSF